MRLTKHAHACVSLEQEGTHLLLDPGTFTPDAADLLARATAVLVTHDHVDHLDLDAVTVAVAARPELVVLGPASVVAALADRGARAEQTREVSDGDRIDVGGVPVAVVGSTHAVIHESVPVPENRGYVIADAVYHPGDSYLVPGVPVDTLLVPCSGPWTQMGQAIDFVRAVAPRRSVPVHDAMLSEIGLGSVERFLGEAGPGGVPLVRLAPGEAIEL